jgi:hypothetical protein
MSLGRVVAALCCVLWAVGWVLVIYSVRWANKTEKAPGDP